MLTFKPEEQLFTNKTDWTTTEMQEWVASVYGENSLEKAIEALKQLEIDIDNGVIKQTSSFDFNLTSVKAYAKKHPLFSIKSKWYSYNNNNGAALFMTIDNKEYTLRDKWDVSSVLDKIENITLEDRFLTLSAYYKDKEKLYAEENAYNLYCKENNSRIYYGELCYGYLHDLTLFAVPQIKIEKNISNDGYSTYYDYMVRYYANKTVSRNKYGELLYNNEIIPEDKVKQLLELSIEFSNKTIALAKEHERLMKHILEGGN